MSEVAKRFLEYVSYDTQSQEEQNVIPSTKKQLILAKKLAEELEGMGAENVRITDQGYVYADIPATTNKPAPVLGFIAHMDTAPSFSGKDVKPKVIENYDGKSICLNPDLDIWMTAEDFPDLKHVNGQTLITTDGNTLLGADDKAGIAEILTMADWFLKHPEEEHGKICIGFTPDEEVGRGADGFDVKAFGADVAYTVDGGPLGELTYENFNGASGRVTIHGRNIHPGSGKGQMKNALLMGMEFQAMLPVFENPMYTEGYEGFFHLDSLSGSVEEAKLDYIIRDHDMDRFEEKKKLFVMAAEFMNYKYGKGTVEAYVKDSYYNMKEKIKPHMYLIDKAKASMEKLGIQPLIEPIRGGTDGARLSYMGLPCPNICTGGHNFHGKFEYITVEAMEKVTELLIEITKSFIF